MSSTFTPRPATEEDLPAILEIERKSYKLPWTEQNFKEELQKPYTSFLILTDDQADSIIAGYVIFWLIFDEAHILNIAIHPDWRGLKLATCLMTHVRNAALKKLAHRIFLEVRKSNHTAVQFYQKEGFFIESIRPKFYEDGEDAYFMALYLTKDNDF